MVSKRVEIITKSYQDEAPAVKWACDGSPEFTMEEVEKSDRGTDIVLHMDEEHVEYLEEAKIEALLNKYCKFLPVPIVFGKKREWKEGKMVDTDEDNVINQTEPLWKKQPAGLKDDDYLQFYRDLYPHSFTEEPMFWIHLNVDYPFHLTGILYFPKIKSNLDLQRDKIQLYCNQVFVTDSVEGIVPEFLTLLHGVIDSPDIPLNVSRSYLQSDNNVKKISNHITKKVADRLEELFKKDRALYEEKWESLKLFVEYGMLTEERFVDRAMKFVLLKNSEGNYFTLDEYKTLVEASQENKEGELLFLYSDDLEEQHTPVSAAKEKGYDVLLMDGQLDVHWMGLLERKREKTRFVRVDSDTVEHLIEKGEATKVELTDEQQEILGEAVKAVLPPIEKTEFSVEFKALGEQGVPVQITRNEFSRRMKEMAAMQQQMAFYGEMPDMCQVVLNVDDPRLKTWMTENENVEKEKVVEKAKNDDRLKQMIDLALLSSGMLKGEALSDFVKRNFETI
jgi:molecular chaperone HtpG